MSLLERYIIARWKYAIGVDGVDDIEYRMMHEQLLKEMPDNEYVNRSWSDDPCPIELLKKYDLMELYRNIKFDHKSESIESLNSESAVENVFRSLDEKSRLSYKLDGFNIQVNYYNGKVISAETRGRTGNSLNANVVTNVVPESIPLGGKVKVTGELVIRSDKWEEFKAETGNTSQRSSVSTAMANEMYEYLQFVAFSIQSDLHHIAGDHYDLLQSYGFTTPVFMTVSNYSQLRRAIDLMGKRYAVYRYPADGLVLENSKCQYAIRIGEFQEEIAESYVTGYVRKFGIYKRPIVVSIAPVMVEGAKRSFVSVTNLQYVLDCNLQIGSPIAFDIRSMADAVLNETKTKQLQEEWNGRFDSYREMIDQRDV